MKMSFWQLTMCPTMPWSREATVEPATMLTSATSFSNQCFSCRGVVSTPIFGELFQMDELFGSTTFPEKHFMFLMLAQYHLTNSKMNE